MANPMIPRERCDYSAIVDRPPLKLPGKARIVFWSIVNYEVWDIGKPMARQVLPAPTGVSLMPDVVHWGFHANPGVPITAAPRRHYRGTSRRRGHIWPAWHRWRDPFVI
jgi:hypothetical protein